MGICKWPKIDRCRHSFAKLLRFVENIHSLLHHKKLFQGWKNLRLAAVTRQIRAASNIMACHISANGRSVLAAPSSLSQHTKLPPLDKEKWDAAYKEEWDGLQALGTWETITEEEYKSLKPIAGTALPSMAISTIKYDRDGNPQ